MDKNNYRVALDWKVEECLCLSLFCSLWNIGREDAATTCWMNTWATIVLGSKHLTILSKHLQLKRTAISIQQLCIIFPFPIPHYEQFLGIIHSIHRGDMWAPVEGKWKLNPAPPKIKISIFKLHVFWLAMWPLWNHHLQKKPSLLFHWCS